MPILKSDFKKDLIILLLATVLLGSVLVIAGGYIADNYFSNMVSGFIGEYGEYDILFTLSQEKEDLALEQIKSNVNTFLPGAEVESGPKVVGSSNYLLKLPEQYKNEEVYTNFDRYFGNIPGLLSRTIITEPRLAVRGFRGESQAVIRELVEDLEGIDFVYSIYNGFDVVVEKPELIPEVKSEIDDILDKYTLFEIRYPLDQEIEVSDELRGEVISLAENKINVEKIKDVTGNEQSERESLLKSLKQMRTFLLSYATKIEILDVENSRKFPSGTELIISEDNKEMILKVVDNENEVVTALIQEGDIEAISSKEIYSLNREGEKQYYLGKGQVNNPRQELTESLDKLDEITPKLEVFLSQSEELVAYSNRLNEDLDNLNEGLGDLQNTSQKLNQSLNEWQENQLSNFLNELTEILTQIEENVGDINQVQKQLILSSNQMREAAGLISEKMIYIPRNNNLYHDLEELKNLFLQVSSALDENYETVTDRMEEMDPLITSIDDWKEKINSLLKVEDTLSSGADWDEISHIVDNINETANIIDTSNLQVKLSSIQKLLEEVKTSQLPVVLEQLEYIQQSLPDLEESELVETINLIDDYLAGEIIPGEQIQLLIKGNFNENILKEKVKPVINNPAVTIISQDAGALQPNPRGEVFNVLQQVRSVISILIAFIFTLLVLILDQTLVISIIKMHGKKALIYSFLTGSIIFSSIYYISQISFPYLNLQIIFLIGGILGIIVGLFSKMLNPVSKEEWEAGKALGFSSAEIMQEIIIPSGRPGLLYLLNYPKITFK